MSVSNSKYFSKGSRMSRKKNMRKPRKPRINNGFTGVIYRSATNWDSQYLDLASSELSATFRVDLLTSTARLGAQVVRFKAKTLVLQTYQPADVHTTYRVDVIRHKENISLEGSTTPVDPIIYYTAQPTTTNFIDSQFRVPRDQVRPSSLVSSTIFTQETRYAHDPLRMLTKIHIPAHIVEYDPDSGSGASGKGLFFVVIMTDATADSINYGVHGYLTYQWQIKF